MPSQLLSSFEVADFTLRYHLDPKNGRVGMDLIPTRLLDQVVNPRDGFLGMDARPVESLVQIKITGDVYSSSFAQGHTMRNSGSHDRFRYHSQECVREGTETVIVTNLSSPDGLQLEHRAAWF